ncbi:MAG: hypothetical protein IKG47_00400 [Oscillospiraceae bacterium]|nr:hypothetical protein [Clostridiales bacterium]MBR3353805.1 hypothetical protein [Oscillospiraceae bacterium]
MKKIIYLEEALEKQVFSRDLREFVVPVRSLKNLLQADAVDKSDMPDVEKIPEMLKALFNRCLGLTQGQMCVFCSYKEECNKYRSLFKKEKD